MISSAKTITQQIITGKNLKISNKQLQIEQLVKLDNRNVLLLNVFTLMSKYRYHVNKYARVYQMNDVDAQKYRYKPYMLSNDLYGTIELAPLIMHVNHMTSVTEFKDLEQGIKLISSDFIDFLNEVLVKEKTIITANRNSIKKEILEL